MRYGQPGEEIPAKDIRPKDSMSDTHPLRVFLSMAEILEIEMIRILKDDSGRERSYYFTLFQMQEGVTKERLAALNEFSDILAGSSIRIDRQAAVVSYTKSEAGNESLNLRVYITETPVRSWESGTLVLDVKKNFSADLLVLSESPHVTYAAYENGALWEFAKGIKKGGGEKQKSHPCTMKDIFYYQDNRNILRKVFFALMCAWGKANPIWKDLAKDFWEGCCYSSIPISLIWESHSKRELIEKRYHHSLKRYNKISIGDAIVLERARRVCKEEEIQKLYDVHFPPYFIGREKKDMIRPLSWALIYQIGWKSDRVYIEDLLNMMLEQGDKIPLSMMSAAKVCEKHDAYAKKLMYRGVPAVKIPKGSRFRRLKMPDDCVHITSRKALIEEACVQKNCVASYADEINRDESSIWSMRKESGERYTIEVIIWKGEYQIRQMYGPCNELCPVKDRIRVQDMLDRQQPGVRRNENS